jgi:hypothetical protein
MLDLLEVRYLTKICFFIFTIWSFMVQVAGSEPSILGLRVDYSTTAQMGHIKKELNYLKNWKTSYGEA